MSRIGRKPVTVPASVKISIADSTVHVEGPKGKLQYRHRESIGVSYDEAGQQVLIDIVYRTSLGQKLTQIGGRQFRIDGDRYDSSVSAAGKAGAEPMRRVHTTSPNKSSPIPSTGPGIGTPRAACRASPQTWHRINAASDPSIDIRGTPFVGDGANGRSQSIGGASSSFCLSPRSVRRMILAGPDLFPPGAAFFEF